MLAKFISLNTSTME